MRMLNIEPWLLAGSSETNRSRWAETWSIALVKKADETDFYQASLFADFFFQFDERPELINPGPKLWYFLIAPRMQELDEKVFLDQLE